MFSSRVSLFLGARTLFFIVFAINSSELAVLTQVTRALGTLLGVIWVYVSMLSIFVQLNLINNKLHEISDAYADVKSTFWLWDPQIWMGVLLPVALITMWGVLLAQAGVV